MIITKTPLRISIAGGGTDLREYYKNSNYGMCINMPINKYIYITVNPKFDNSIRLSYSKTENVNTIDELQHDIARECLRMAGITGGIEIVSIADIPAGTGLGSSSSFTVGLLNALYSYKGITLPQDILAKKACEIEIDILKHNIGKQDQYACAYGGINEFKFYPDESVTHKHLDIDINKLNKKLMLFYTGLTHNAGNILKNQDYQNKKENYDNIKALAENFNFDDLPLYLHKNWMLKKESNPLSSNNFIDEKYNLALSNGALGGKLLGAGGGGFLLFYCDEDKQEKVRDSIGLREVDFRIAKYGTRVIYAN